MRKNHGYNFVYEPKHPKADKRGYIKNCVLVCEFALEKLLPDESVVHHVNGDRGDDRSSNLVVCESRSYHMLLHHRLRALEACGHADWRKCWYCGRWSPVDEIYVRPNNRESIHRKCRAVYESDYRVLKKRR